MHTNSKPSPFSPCLWQHYGKKERSKQPPIQPPLAAWAHTLSSIVWLSCCCCLGPGGLLAFGQLVPKLLCFYPFPGQKLTICTTQTWGHLTFPQPFDTACQRALLDRGVFKVDEWAVRFNSIAWRQNVSCYLPPPHSKIISTIPSKIKAATPSPGHSSPNAATLHLIVMLSALETGRSDQMQPPGCKMKAIPPPSPPTKIVDLPS